MMGSWILLIGLICAVLIVGFKVNEWQSYLIIALQAFAIILLFSGNKSIGFYILGGTSILAFIYSMFQPGNVRKWQFVIFFVPLIVVFLFGSLNLPGANIIRLLMLLPIIIFGLMLLQLAKFYKSVSYMSVYVAFAITELLELIKPW